MFRTAVLTIAVLLAACATASTSTPAEPLSDAQEAVRIVRAAADAMGGGDALTNAQRINVGYDGRVNSRHQGLTPDQGTPITATVSLHGDIGARRVFFTQTLRTPTGEFTQSGSFTGVQDQSATLGLRVPHLVLREALTRPRDLRLVSRSATSTIIAAPLFSRTAHLQFNAQNQLVRAQFLIDDARYGDSVTIMDYLDYAQRGALSAPARMRERVGDVVTLEATITSYAIDAAAPDWVTPLASAPAPAAAPAAPAITTEQLAPGIHSIVGPAGANYRMLAVELDDGLMLLETPNADMRSLREALARVSSRPLRYAAPTHHHDDHAGGAALLEDVTLLVSGGNQDYFTDMTSAPRLFRTGRAARSALPMRVIRDGERVGPVQFLNLRTLHATEHFVFYFPDHGILLQSDLITFPVTEQADVDRPQVCDLYSFIRRNNLRVTRLMGVHGQTASLADLDAVVARRTTPCAA